MILGLSLPFFTSARRSRANISSSVKSTRRSSMIFLPARNTEFDDRIDTALTSDPDVVRAARELRSELLGAAVIDHVSHVILVLESAGGQMGRPALAGTGRNGLSIELARDSYFRLRFEKVSEHPFDDRHLVCRTRPQPDVIGLEILAITGLQDTFRL